MVAAIPEPYEPLVVSPITIHGGGPYRPGGELVYSNGVCNRSSEAVTGIVSIGLQRETSDALIAAQTVVILDGLTVPFGAGTCAAHEPVATLVPVAEPGLWRVYAIVVVMGPQAGQIQRVTLLSEPFVISE